jgi:hypothetical protein
VISSIDRGGRREGRGRGRGEGREGKGGVHQASLGIAIVVLEASEEV